MRGVAIAKIVVDREGTVRQIAFTSEPGFGLAEMAEKEPYQWRFAPGKRGGTPVAVSATVEVHFTYGPEPFLSGPDCLYFSLSSLKRRRRWSRPARRPTP